MERSGPDNFTKSRESNTGSGEPLEVVQELLQEVRQQTRHLADIKASGELEICLLDKIARIVCITANETHRQTQQLTALFEAFQSFLEIYKAVHPDQTLQIERFEKVRAELR